MVRDRRVVGCLVTLDKQGSVTLCVHCVKGLWMEVMMREGQA